MVTEGFHGLTEKYMITNNVSSCSLEPESLQLFDRRLLGGPDISLALC